MVDFALVIPAFDYIIVDPSKRKYATYKEIGWNDQSIKNFLVKENYERIASFITSTVSFSASSRRNRYYEIYNSEDMLKLEESYPDAIEGIVKLSKHFDIHIITSRTTELQDLTTSHLLELGFPMEKIYVYFKDVHESLHNYKRFMLRKITAKYSSGVGIITHPKDAQLFIGYQYSVIGLDTIKDESEFINHVEFVCHDWKQICSALEQE